jgi:hypothetical protein
MNLVKLHRFMVSMTNVLESTVQSLCGVIVLKFSTILVFRRSLTAKYACSYNMSSKIIHVKMFFKISDLLCAWWPISFNSDIGSNPNN